jgi:hypothetical protein
MAWFQAIWERKTSYLRMFVLLLWTIFTPFQAAAQLTPSTTLAATAQDSTQAAAPVLRVGFDKLVNTFLFRADLNGVFTAFGGNLFVRQQYRGSIIRTNTPAVRDDEDLLLRYERPLWDSLSLVLAGTALISADTRSIGLNRLQQYTLSAGALYKPLENVRVSMTGGGEFNEQLGVADRGWNVTAQAALTNQRFDEYTLAAEASAVYSALSNARTNAQTGARVSVGRTFEGGGTLDFSAQYGGLQRDFYTFVGNQAGNVVDTVNRLLPIETRNERLWRLALRASVPLLHGPETSIDADVQGFFESWTIGRSFRAPVDGATFTAVGRTVEQTRFSVNAALRAVLPTSSHALSLVVDTRDEVNIIADRFGLAAADVLALRLAEGQRDNASVRTSVAAQTAWQLFASDTVKAEYSTSLLRYDTPSTLNNDDRDEWILSANAAYTHRFSPWLAATLLAETRLFHLVFIKAQRSAQNNWNRSFRFAPSVTYMSESFSARPQFELLANYTSFDFEDVLTSAQSFSFRQVAYRDSLVWQMGAGATLETRIIFRYFERGEFRWREFAELPRDRNYEAFVRILAFSMVNELLHNATFNNVRIGIGARIYALSQRGATPSTPVPTFLNQTIGPEMLCEMPFLSGTMLRLSGWYEFQFDQTRLLRSIPNVFLSIAVPLAIHSKP